MTVTLPAGVSAIGADFFSLVNSSTLLLSLNTGESFILSAPGVGSGMSFFGVTSTSTITSFTVEQAPGISEPYFGLDNLSFGAAVTDVKPVPEPSTTLLLGAGLSALVARRRRSRPVE